MAEDFGNPSSTHSFGRNAKSVLNFPQINRQALNACARNNFLLQELKPTIDSSVAVDLKVKRIITCKTEHHAVLYSSGTAKEFGIQIDYVAVKP
jgi:cysteine desulfurase